MDTFQLIAFVLSAFNVASIMAANANNNNNNNNINDNNDDINDNNINESNTNAEVMSMVMVGLGGRGLTKRSTGTMPMETNEHIAKGNTKNLNDHKLVNYIFFQRSYMRQCLTCSSL